MAAGVAGLLMDRLAGDWEAGPRLYVTLAGVLVLAAVAIAALQPDLNYSLGAGILFVTSGAVMAVPGAVKLIRRRRAPANESSHGTDRGNCVRFRERACADVIGGGRRNDETV